MKVQELLESTASEESLYLSDRDFEMAIQTTRRLNELYHIQGAKGLAEVIRLNAASWLQQTNKGEFLFYRGTHAINIPIALESWKERARPVDTELPIHHIYNTLIAVAGGQANRNTKWFTISDKSYARDRGNLYIFIPLGKFHFTYSPVARDWTNNFSYHLMSGALRSPEQRAEIDKSVTDKVMEYIKVRPELAHLDLNILKETSWFWLEQWGDFFNNPSNYDPAAVKKIIKTEKTGSLYEAYEGLLEVMFKAKAGLYLEPDVWHRVKNFL
jgi:hypothetical protein